jgi:hypothetical protein
MLRLSIIIRIFPTPMKNHIIRSLILLAMLGSSSCISVITEHKIEPIRITVDIHVKVDRALDDFFGDLDAKAQDLSSN